MKKMIVVIVMVCLTITFFSVTPARANRFWPGVAVGVGSALLLGQMFDHPRAYYYPPRAYYHHYYPVRVYAPPAYYYPTIPAYREQWVPGHWVERHGPYGNVGRYWVSGHWERY